MKFVHLHLHSHYSLLDGMINLKKLCRHVKDLGMDSVAVTDHGSMFSAVHFFQAAKEVGIKPILGMEVYIAPEERTNKSPRSLRSGENIAKYYHLLLLAKDQTGYQNLIQLASKAYLEGFYYRPRIDKELLFQHSKGLICSSACLAGEVQRLILANRLEAAEQVMLEYKSVFGDDYYFEVMRHGIEEQEKVNEAGARLARSLGIKLLATNDAHYLTKEDAEMHKILLNIQRSSGDALREYSTGEFYVKSPEQMYELFKDMPDAVENSVKIAEQCNFQFKFGDFHFPKVDLPEGMTTMDLLRKLTWEGFTKRYPTATPEGELGQRVNYELGVIDKMGFAAYFLIVRDFIVHAKDELDMMVGPARGSVGGSIVAYCLRIIDIDPIKFDLMFERFLNPERVSMPDIDTDFPERRRDEVIKYVTAKYGEEYVSQICTIVQIKARTAIKDVGRVLEAPIYKMEQMAKSFPMNMSLIEATTINDDDEDSIRLQKEAAIAAMNLDEETRRVFNLATQLEGTPRNIGVHAAGVVIADRPIYEYVPMAKEKENVTTQFDMTVLEPLGLIKMDFLGLRTLDVIRDAIDLIRLRHGVSIDINNLPDDDKPTCDMLCEGHTKGVFQADSSGMREVIKEISPRHLLDCVPIVALYRPGPLESGMVTTYINCRHGRQPVESFYPTLEPVTKDTYGIFLFQEQIMKGAQVLSGFTIGEADELRKAIGKKNAEKLAKLRKKFVEGAKRTNPHDPDVESIADDIYTKIEFFGRYCFNKAHSAAYGLIMYQTAYLKANYPTEYMCALLASVVGRENQIIPYLREAKRMGIKVLSPHINKSMINFSVEEDMVLRFGLIGIKGISETTAKEILEARGDQDFSSFYDVLERCHANVAVCKGMVMAGAMDCFGYTRRTLHEKLDGSILKKVAEVRREQETGQIGMFDDDEGVEIANYGKMVDLPEFDEKELLAKEKALLGVYLSKHPVDKYRSWLENVPDLQPIAKLVEMKDGQPVVVAGIISSMKTIVTRKGDAMAFLQVDDRSGDTEAVVFASTYANYQNTISPDNVVLLEGYVQIEETESDESDVVSKQAKLIVIGVSNIEKSYKLKKAYVPSAEFSVYKSKKPRRSGGMKAPSKYNPPTQPKVPAAQAIKIPTKVRVIVRPENLPILLEIFSERFVPGTVDLEVCIGKGGGAGIVVAMPNKIDIKAMDMLFTVKGLSCQAEFQQ